MTILSCDNLPENGAVTKTVVCDLAALLDQSLNHSLRTWIEANVDFATSMVDRITPGTTDEDRKLVEEACGYIDAYPVPTEPFNEWVISGAFPAGRPRWEEAGVTLVTDVGPFEQRKLWLLNGSHSMLAYAGSIRGHQTIDEAIADDDCRSWVEAFWDEASRHVSLPAEDTTKYRQALLNRFSNPRAGTSSPGSLRTDQPSSLCEHSPPFAPSAQQDASPRGAPPQLPHGCCTCGGWVRRSKTPGCGGSDCSQRCGLDVAIPAVLSLLEPGLGDDRDFVDAVLRQARAIQS